MTCDRCATLERELAEAWAERDDWSSESAACHLGMEQLEQERDSLRAQLAAAGEAERDLGKRYNEAVEAIHDLSVRMAAVVFERDEALSLLDRAKGRRS